MKNNKLRFFIFIYLFFTIVFLPLANGGKGAAAKAILEIGCFMLSFFIFMVKTFDLKKSGQPLFLVLGGALFVWAVLGSFWNATFFNIFPSILLIASYFCLFFIVQSISSPKFTAALLWVFVLMGGVTIGYSLYQLLMEQGPRVSSTFPNSNLFGGYLLIPLGCAVALLRGAKKYRFALMLIILFHIVGLVITSSRGALLAALGMGIWLVFRTEIGDTLEKRSRRRKIFFSLLTMGLLAVFIIPNPLLNRLANIRAGVDAFSYGRLKIWESVGKLILDHPITGCGWGGFPEAIAPYAFPSGEASVRYGRAVNFAHNEFLQVAAESGLIGLALYLAFLYFIFKALWTKTTERSGLAAQLVFLSFLIHSLVDFNLHPPALSAGAIILLAAHSEYKSETTLKNNRSYGFAAVLAVLGFLCSCLLARAELLAYWADQSQTVSSSISYYQKALKGFSWKAEWRDALGKLYERDLSLSQEERFFLSRQAFRKSSAQYPLNPFPHFHLAKLYAQTGEPALLDQSVGEYQRGLTLDPFYSFARFEWGVLYFNHGLYPQAILVWTDLLEVEPNYLGAMAGLGLCYEKMGDPRQANQWWSVCAAKSKFLANKKLPGQTDYEKRVLYLPLELEARLKQ